MRLKCQKLLPCINFIFCLVQSVILLAIYLFTQYYQIINEIGYELSEKSRLM